MSTNTQSADLIRVTVTAGDRTLDLVLPSRLPLAEIVPEVAGLIGSLDAYEAYGGYALVGSDGRALDLDASFLAQGVHDGQVLTLVTGAEAEEKKVYDDVVEAVADSVEGLGAGWTAQNSRATALGLSALLLGLGAVALFLQRQGGFVVTVVAGAARLLLLLAGAVFARVRVDVAAAVVVLIGSAVYAVVAALSAVAGDVRERPLVVAGIALAVVGGLSMALLRDHAWAFLPGVVLGLAAAATGGVLLASTFDPNKVIAIVVVVAVILGSLIPWFALSSSRTMVTPMQSESEILAEPAAIDPDRVQRGIDLAHDLVLGLSLSVAIVVVLGAPSVVALGWAGLGIIWAAGIVQMMRTRQFLLARDVVVGLLGGTITALLQHPSWGVVIGPVVGVAAAAVLVSLALPDKATVRKGRILDLCEGLALFALVPLLVIALGLFAAFRS